MKYRVKAGTHEQGGVSYKAGEIVISDLQLDKMFLGKFEPVLVPESDVPAKREKVAVTNIADEVEEEDQEEEKPAPKPRKKRKSAVVWND